MARNAVSKGFTPRWHNDLLRPLLDRCGISRRRVAVHTEMGDAGQARPPIRAARGMARYTPGGLGSIEPSSSFPSSTR